MTYFQAGHPDSHVRMVEESMKHIKDGGLRQDQFLQILRVEGMAIHVNCWEEDGLHLVIAEFISWLMGSN